MTDQINLDFIRDIGLSRGFNINESEARHIQQSVRKQFESVQDLNDLDLSLPSPPDRDYIFPDDDADPNGVFITTCKVSNETTGVLHGQDIGVKDNIAVAGIPMTCGSPVLKQHIPDKDAAVVQLLLKEGGRIVGKTNMDEFALGGDESTMRFKTTRNPHASSRHPGGSSLGSAVGVVKGDFDIGIGTDTGGSVRIPASWSGLTGLKPTWGTVPLDGVFQYSKTLDTVGILASGAEACFRTFSVLSKETKTTAINNISTSKEEQASFLSELSIGVVSDLFGEHVAIDTQVRQAIDRLESEGATVREVSIPNSEYIVPCWLAISMAEFGTYLDTKGVPYWSDSSPMFSLVGHLSNRSEIPVGVIGDHIRDTWLASVALRERFDDEHYTTARQFRKKLQSSVQSALKDVDVLASPTLPMTPPQLREGFGDVSKVIKNPGLFNLTGHPCVSTPCGRVDGLPVGIQFAGGYNQEELVCKLATCVPKVDRI